MRGLLLRCLNFVARLRGRDSIWVSQSAVRVQRKIDEIFGGMAEQVLTYPTRSRLPAIVATSPDVGLSETDKYWARHTVRGKTFLSKQVSLDYIRELTDGRPLKRDLLLLHGPHDGKVILDYGCGPGNDLAGFAEYSNAAKIIGADISAKALKLARQRVSWHARNPEQMMFIQIADNSVRLPLADRSVDYIQSLGVIHHASDPPAILREFHRLLRQGGEARIMLYNADSVHVQLEVGYAWRFVNGVMTDKSPEDAFSTTADLGAPIALCVRPPDVKAWLRDIPFDLEFVGGFFVPGEADGWMTRRDRALEDSRISAAQRHFLSTLESRNGGLAYFNDKPAGLGGVYILRKSGQ